MSATNENAHANASGPMTPLRTLDSSILHQFASPRWSSTIDEQQRARALASGAPIDVPYTVVNPLALSSAAAVAAHHHHQKNNAPQQQNLPSPLPKRLLPSAWRNGPQPSPLPTSDQPIGSRHPLLSQPLPQGSKPHEPSQPPVFVLHRRADRIAPPAPVLTAQAHQGQEEGKVKHDHHDADSPPSPPLLPTIRSSARKAFSSSATAAGKGAERRTLYRSAPALAAAAEPLTPETPHRDWAEDLSEEEDDEDEQQVTIRPPKHQVRLPHAKSQRALVSTATAMTPYQHLAAPQHSGAPNYPDLHRAPTPIVEDHGSADNPGRMTRSRARHLQRETLTAAIWAHMQPLLDAFTACTATTLSTILLLFSFCITRPIRWLSNQTSPLVTISVLVLLVLLLLSWALEPPSDPVSRPTIPQPTMPEIDTLVHQIAEMEQATMHLVYQQDALEAADAAHAMHVREEVSTTVAQVAGERVTQAVEVSVTRAVDEAVISVLDQVRQLTLGVAEMASEVTNLTLRMDQPDPISPTASPTGDADSTLGDEQGTPEVPTISEPSAPLVNYASLSSGARALSAHSSPTHHFPMHPEAVIGGWLPARIIPWFLRPGVPAHGHNWALHADMQRGSCWATALGAGGRAPAKLTLRLARPVRPRAVAVWHHTKGGGEAPRDVRVYGRRVRDHEWYLVASGEYVLREDRGERQVFEVHQGVDEEVDHVRFVVERNWGAKDYTCLYRVEVLAPVPAAEAVAVKEVTGEIMEVKGSGKFQEENGQGE